MWMKKWYAIINLIIFALFIMVSGCFENDTSYSQEGFTGFERVEKAYFLAENNSNNISLFMIQCSNFVSDGKCKNILFSFYDITFNHTNNTYTNQAEVKVSFEINKEPSVWIIPKNNIPISNESQVVFFFGLLGGKFDI